MGIESSDQWNLDGDCDKCRRNKYCGSTCKAHREKTKAREAEMRRKVLNYLLKNSEEATGYDKMQGERTDESVESFG